MLTLRTLAIIGVFAGLPLTDARACDDDRYPCPVRSEALTQETADAPTQPLPSAQPQKKSTQPQKKAKQPAGSNEKAHAKRERETPRPAARAKVSMPVMQEQASDSVSQKSAEAAPAVPPSRADQPANDEIRNENLVATAATALPILPNTEGAGDSGASADTTETAKANAVQLVDPNEVNEPDRAAEAVLAESSWSTYLLLLLGAALAAASAMWFFSRMTSMFARRAANPRMHMSRS
jgi:hypothetical protein